MKQLIIDVLTASLITVAVLAITWGLITTSHASELDERCKNTLSAVSNARVGDKLCKEDYSFAVIVGDSAIEDACKGVPRDYRLDIRLQYETVAKTKAVKDVIRFCNNLTKGRKFDNIWVTR